MDLVHISCTDYSVSPLADGTLLTVSIDALLDYLDNDEAYFIFRLLLPDEINQIGAFHRQKLNKTVVTLSLQEDYQVNDSNCYRIHRLEKELFGKYAPAGFDCDDAITYEWNESREWTVLALLLGM